MAKARDEEGGAGEAGTPKRRGRRLAGKVGADGKKRVTFEFYPETVEAIERVRLRVGAITANEAIRKAVGLLETYLDARDAGAKTVYEYPDGAREVMRVV